MPPVIAFIGYHDSGKTTLASKVVRRLSRRGYRVAVVKSTKETGLVLDRPGSDTFQHRAAGAETVILAAPDQVAVWRSRGSRDLHALVRRYGSDADLVVAEGFKQAEGVPKIEVARPGGPLLMERVSGVIALVGDVSRPGVACFGRNEDRAVADFVEQRLLRSGNGG